MFEAPGLMLGPRGGVPDLRDEKHWRFGKALRWGLMFRTDGALCAGSDLTDEGLGDAPSFKKVQGPLMGV